MNKIVVFLFDKYLIIHTSTQNTGTLLVRQFMIFFAFKGQRCLLMQILLRNLYF